MLDLSELNPERFFVVGGVCGSDTSLIDILFEQNFTYRDILVLAGNFIDKESDELLDLLFFLQNNENCFSVLGKNEVEFLEEYEKDELPEIMYDIVDKGLISFISNLPLIIKLPNNYYVVNAGVQPFKLLQEQDETVFYSIGEYDEESRFYQFFNPDKKHWYEFDFEGDIICFTNDLVDQVEVPAGYNLGSIESGLHCLILSSDDSMLITPSSNYYNKKV